MTPTTLAALREELADTRFAPSDADLYPGVAYVLEALDRALMLVDLVGETEARD
ncbi:hypothetical protein [Streptomyces sp. NRRL F-5630]|uniref:hypothetical protein n=1 Tax=Streptomyces sp. NRRL F-5630 TaxID=1463864 RepID=UPI000A5E649D|nr:hypothetical protein [Streptomyces sp. NRRL F-5630]